ncbi:hypothetical protein [Rhodococcus sp. 11-3]|uniref:hypothetical protein n=1 Tax=Rhodococcus sp. 11-3 TaxID=2854796 RepID=UPI00203A84C8|nr:hypothetical protein [Rhodococcus sp. 11-3]USC17015.1 hypothetical protein KZJ41_09175 [Rhodococcus sp. 11-3]
MKELERRIVKRLLRDGPLPTVGDLSEALGVILGDLQPALDRLLKIGMIEYGIGTPRGPLVSIGGDLIYLRVAHIAATRTLEHLETAVLMEHLRHDNAEPRG